MKKLLGLAIGFALLAPAVLAQESYTEGAVWRVELIRVKPNYVDTYLASLRKNSKPVFEEEKSQGLIVDYKIFLKETKNDPQDWDVCVAIEYKNHAAMDGLDAKTDAIENKILGGQAQARSLSETRQDYREIISNELLQEITLK
jgi:hypothetical protein